MSEDDVQHVARRLARVIATEHFGKEPIVAFPFENFCQERIADVLDSALAAIRAENERLKLDLVQSSEDMGRICAENAKCRAIISECAAALGNGAVVSPECTVDFMAHVPNEIRLYVAKLKEAAP